ncbi:hypothetical protein EG68_01964 [Paragonimus skrjabini miyazakii]|uniref:Uncharacterized protein n=1 Tax=Paragonimus skrjabini miyazakii TaxID=59628 RepID=A0A8S9ZAB6_9TREM|nr:hypothetical protein EG68_01964 [Paragonimus skrjabini miyazakii]
MELEIPVTSFARQIIRDKPTTGNGLMLQSVLLIKEGLIRRVSTGNFAQHISSKSIRQAREIENLWLTTESQQSVADGCLVEAMWINNWPPESHDYLGSITLVLDGTKDEAIYDCPIAYYFLPRQTFTLNQAPFVIKDHESY